MTQKPDGKTTARRRGAGNVANGVAWIGIGLAVVLGFLTRVMPDTGVFHLIHIALLAVGGAILVVLAAFLVWAFAPRGRTRGAIDAYLARRAAERQASGPTGG